MLLEKNLPEADIFLVCNPVWAYKSRQENGPFLCTPEKGRFSFLNPKESARVPYILEINEDALSTIFWEQSPVPPSQ